MLFRETLLWEASQHSYLLQVINPSFPQSLAWLCLLAQCPPRGEPSFWVTILEVMEYALAWKDVSIVLVSQATAKRIIQHPNDCWICHNAADPMASASVEQTQPPLYHVRLLNPRGPFLCFWSPTPNLGTLHPGTEQRKGHKARATKIKTPVLSTDP